MDNKIKTISMIVVFLVCIVMVVLGQRNVGYSGLAIEIVGLIGILVVIFMYNKDHK